MHLTILKVWDYEYPWDVRVEKICKSLTGAGHRVHLVARNRGRAPRHEVLPEATVHRLGPLPWLGRRLEATTMFPAFFNPRWVKLIYSQTKRLRPDMILARDLPLTLTALAVGRWFGIPVVLDMAENYPAMIRDLWDTGSTRRWDHLVRNPRAVAYVERVCLQMVDHVLVVVEESRDRLMAMGTPEEKITIVSNTPPFSPAAKPTTAQKDGERLFRVVYLGLMERARGIDTLLAAVGECYARGARFRVDLIGDGRQLREFKEAAESRFGTDARDILFHGFLPHDSALEIVRQAHIGVIPHHVAENWNTTIPNKLFDYMAAGVAVVASNAAPVARVIQETGCGRVFEDRNPLDLAESLLQMMADQHFHRYGQAGRAAHIDKYNWRVDSGRLVEALERIAVDRFPKS